MLLAPRAVEIRHFHLFAGLGGGARGFNRGRATVGHVTAKFRCTGGIDVDKAAMRDFGRLAGVRGTVLDLFSREQYEAFHGHPPPDGWREATPDDVLAASGGEYPHIGFGSAPCKGFSGLLSESRSGSAKYQALNQLALRGLWLALEAFKDNPCEFWLWENVPRIATRGRAVLDQMIRLLRAYGYAVVESTHDCGELGGLGQSRKRFLLVARHMGKVPPFLYEPPKRPLRSVGEIIGRLPVPGPDMVLPMHRLPSLQWQTWVRLAFVEAGSDWRSLNKLEVADGVLRDFRLVPDGAYHNGALGVSDWSEHAGTVTGNGRPASGTFSIADPRIDGHARSVQHGVRSWDQPTGVVKGDMSVGCGPYAIADPRIPGAPRFNNVYRIVPWDGASPAIAGAGGPAGGLAVADPRSESGWNGKGKYVVTPFHGPAGTVISGSTTGNGAFAVADPRAPDTQYGRGRLGVKGWDQTSGVIRGESLPSNGPFAVADPRPMNTRDGKTVYKTSGEYGVVPWDDTSGGVTAAATHDNGRWTVADPREHHGSPVASLPSAKDRLVAVIRAIDGTFHRPFTTLELAALQSLVDPDELLELDGASDSAWRERIGNAVPPAAAEAVASVMGQTLLLTWSGETFQLNAAPIWVRPLVIAVAVNMGGADAVA